MELKDLIGERLLSGVDITTEKKLRYGDTYEDAEVVRFILDGKTYKATEDSDDGYRSYLNEIEETDEKISNEFEPQKVIGRMKENSEYQNNDVVQFFDAITEKIVLEVGTENSDDYYPYCVIYWNPENLSINADR